MMKHKASTLILLAGLALGAAGANAQPGQGGGQGGGRQGGRGGMMTPQQMQEMREAAMKTQLTAMGISDTAQTTIIAYSAAREAATTPLRAQGRTLQEGLGNNLSAEAATRQLVAIRAAVQAEKTRRLAAEKELDTAIGYTKNPQLEAYLTLSGLIGDESTYIAAPGMGGRGGYGGGRGNRGGGGQGGPGGPGGMNGGAPA